jgi:2'-5' RNA ligase
LRCFIALGTDAADEQLAPWLDRLRQDFDELSVSPAANLHLTLAFLGEIDDRAVERAADAVRSAAARVGEAAGWTLGWAPPGVFPSRTRPRVLWLGLGAGDERLLEVHSVLREELRARDLPVEERAYRPHLTLARVRRPPPDQRLEAILSRLQSAPSPAPVAVRSLVLFQSRLGPGAAVHEAIVETPLGG